MDMRRSLTGLVAAAMLAFAIAGCPKENAGEGAPGGGGTAKKFRIAVIPKGTAHSFWQTVKAGADAAGKEDNVERVWVGPARENDVTDQIDVVHRQVNSTLAGLALAAAGSTSLDDP